MKEPISRLLCFTFLLLLALTTAAQGFSFSYTVEPDTIFQNQRITLKIKLDHAEIDKVTPANFPDIPGFIQKEKGQQSQFLNGNFNKSYTQSYLPSSTGIFVIPAFKYEYGGQPFLCPASLVTVLEGNGTPPPVSKFDDFWGKRKKETKTPDGKGDEPVAPEN